MQTKSPRQDQAMRLESVSGLAARAIFILANVACLAICACRISAPFRPRARPILRPTSIRTRLLPFESPRWSTP